MSIIYVKSNIKHSAAIIINDNAFLKLSNAIQNNVLLSKARKFLFVIDKKFYATHQKNLDIVLGKLTKNYVIETIDAGELTKSLGGVEMLYQLCDRYDIKRDCALIAIGGGTICDLVGFVAATYMRGVPMINIPTTLMSCVDPVIGKVAVNYALRKNLVGAWFFPEITIIDPILIKKEPPRYFYTGMAEIIKAAFIDSAKTVKLLASDMEKLVTGDAGILKKYIELSARVKIECVVGDEQDLKGEHAKLSFGHTLADAIESLYPFGLVPHGEAVALGMIFAARVNDIIENTRISRELFKKTINLCRAAHLPIKFPIKIDKKVLIAGLLKSKKSYYDSITLILVKNYGVVKMKSGINIGIVRKAFDVLC